MRDFLKGLLWSFVLGFVFLVAGVVMAEQMPSSTAESTATTNSTVTNSTSGSSSGSTSGSTSNATSGSSGSTSDSSVSNQTPSQTSTNQETTCTSGGGKWCRSSDSSSSGWCSYSSSPCPAYDSASCSSQGGEWCTSQYGGGWCSTGSSSGCPINDQSTCEAKSRKWCASSGGGSGWCASVGATCPANDEPSCKAQNGEWCTSQYGGNGWCSTGSSGGCPIYDKSTCEAKSRSWCASSSGGSGWCASTGSSCPNNTYTCSDGTVVSDSTKCSGTNYNNFTWPQSESICTKYKGVWCNYTYSSSYSSMSGYCNMAGYKCSAPAPSGKTTCWDGSVASSWSQCPTTPSTKSDCTAKNYNWCESSGSYSYSSSYSSGWCSSNPCSKMPPSGKMTCPDNETFASKLEECPVATNITPVPQPEPTPKPTTTPNPEIEKTKKCWDGSEVKESAVCPIKYTVCTDGTKVPEGTACPVKTNDEATNCLGKGGKWCLKDGSDSGSGYCTLMGACMTINTSTKNIKIEVPINKPLTIDQEKLVEQKKKEYIRKLEYFEKIFKKYEDSESLQKTAALKEKIQSLPKDTTAFDTLELIKDDMTILASIKDSLIESGRDEVLSERDTAMQAKAMKQIRQKMLALEKQLKIMSDNITRLETQGFVSVGSAKELVTKSLELIEKAKSAQTFDEAKDAAESLTDYIDELNSWMKKMEQLNRTSKLLNLINQQIRQREGEYQRVETLVKRLKVELDDYLATVKDILDKTRTAYEDIKTNTYTDKDPFDYVQENIIDKLEDVDSALANVRALANLKATVNKLSARIKSYDTRIARLAKQKKDVTEMRSLLSELKDKSTEMSRFTKIQLSEADLVSLLDIMANANNLEEQLVDLLKINTPTLLEKELKKGYSSKETIQKIDTSDLEKQVVRAFRTATFYRRAPDQLAEMFSEDLTKSVNRWRNRLVIDF